MLKDAIQEDLKQAMRDKREDDLSTIRMLKSAIQYFEIQKGGAGYEANDEDIIQVLEKEIKKRKESIELYEKGNRQELADKESKEIELLKKYLPQQLTEEELLLIIDSAITTSGAMTIKDMGKVMSILTSQIKGKADAGVVSQIVRSKLGA